jgi:hypothetical protein
MTEQELAISVQANFRAAKLCRSQNMQLMRGLTV